MFTTEPVLTMGVGPYLYVFTVDRAREEDVLVIYILYLHKKMRSVNNHCTGYEYFKDGLIV